MSYSTEKSKALFDRAVRVMVEGGSSPSRGPANYGDYPLFIERGQGAHVFDADGNQYLDWMMAYGALPHGHAHPRIVDAVTQGAGSGALVAAATEIEIEVAELIQQMVPSAERVRFANTGTEATMAAIRLARGYTGRPKFLKFEGHYHGWYDDFLVNAHPHPVESLGHRRDPIKIPDSSGLNRRAVEDTIVAPWNDLAAVERVLQGRRQARAHLRLVAVADGLNQEVTQGTSLELELAEHVEHLASERLTGLLQLVQQLAIDIALARLFRDQIPQVAHLRLANTVDATKTLL